MEETKKTTEKVESWDGAINLVADTVKANRALASETIQSARRESKAKDLALICMTVIIITIIFAYFKNDEHWRNLFGEYDFVT